MIDLEKTLQAGLAYHPLTSETRVEDFVIPLYLVLGGLSTALPKSIVRKEAHFLINQEGLPIRAAWISKPLAHILNSMRLADPEVKIQELLRAMAAVEESISTLVKNGVLKDKHGPGAMAFCQANENVPKDSLLISSRTYDSLCAKNPKWKEAKSVIAVRFPNLGPETTQELKLIINRAEGLDMLNLNLPATALGRRAPQLMDFFCEGPEEIEDITGIVDAFYLHPDILKNSFEGDGRPTCR